MLSTETYGKLYIVGEYQVLSNKGTAIVYGTNKKMFFNISNSASFFYETRNIKKSFHYNNNTIKGINNILIEKSLKVVFMYLESLNIKIKPFTLTITSELETPNNEKYGLGSSSALISGIIKVVLMKFLNDFDPLIVFKLSVLAQIQANQLSSGGDLAAAIYGNYIFYQRYNLKWVLKNYQNINIVNKKWPHLKIERINTNLKFLAIWTKKSYQTPNINNKFNKKEIKKAKKIVKNCYENLENNNYELVYNNINQYQNWFENNIDKQLITPEIKQIISIANNNNLACKISGAGGGDSLIVLNNNLRLDNFKNEINDQGYLILEI